MPELPEVETTRRGLEPLLVGRRITGAAVRNAALRWPVAPELTTHLPGARIEAVQRRAKYLLLATDRGHLLLHLGMSGSLRVLAAGTPALKHDHVDILLDDGRCLRLRDPRRFGSILFAGATPAAHALLARLGPEPLELDTEALGAHLHAASRGRRAAVKSFLMDSGVVVGVGNIYASEALFRAGIRPNKPASALSRPACRRVAAAIQAVLTEAIAAGGTTLRDFANSDGLPGYFAQELSVYGRAGAPCRTCGTPIREQRLGQRSTFWCPACQR
ncbi:MAG: bifunctional DNA-formamidopyrimidine glycosylase/DNA-(apurinic or apyrimidinic site) lyase [Immundisolibacter sp.]